MWAVFLFLSFAAPCASAVGILFEGNAHLSRKKMDAVVSAPENPEGMSGEDWEDWVDETASAITDLYGESGYLDAAIKIEAPGWDTTDAKDARIRISVREGERYRFGSVSIVTVSHAASFLDAGQLRSRSGKPFEKEVVFRDRREILNAYGDAGFLHARSTESLSPDTAAKLINLEFSVDPGPAIVFDTLLIRNLREGDSTGMPGVTSTRLLKGLLRMHRGDTVSLSSTGSFERKLKSTRVFNYVRLRDSLLADKGEGSALVLSTEERVPGEADASVFFETQYGGGVAANWTHGNMLGQLHEGRLGGSWAQRKQSGYAGYASPLFFGTSLRFDNDLVANWYQDSELQKEAGSYEGDFDLTDASRISKSFTSWSRGVSTAELAGQSEKVLAAIGAKTDSVVVDRTFNLNFINSLYFSFLDDAVSPTRGLRWSFTWGNGGSFFRANQIDIPVTSRHNWLEGESAFYYPLSERIKLAFRLDGGRFFGDGGSNSERFFLGGPRSVRSYGWRKVCPERDSSEVCTKIGLEPAYFLTSYEIRSSPFSSAFINPEGRWKWLLGVQVVPFMDYGNVWQVGKTVTPEGKGRAYGLGLRYSLLSIFNLRVDYAVDAWKPAHQAWVLDLAQAF
ncbi:MAG: BamA/TamA family outer membrane protein [Fibrobacteria bacterium]